MARIGVQQRPVPHGGAGAKLIEIGLRAVEGCPRVAVWSGYARSTGCHTNQVRWEIREGSRWFGSVRQEARQAA